MQSATLQQKNSIASNTNTHSSNTKGGVSLPAVPIYQKKPIQKIELEEEQPMQGKFATQLKAAVNASPLPIDNKNATTQLQELEEEMPMQGKFMVQRQELEEEMPVQGKFIIQRKGLEEEMPMQPKFTLQKKANNTGLPNQLKAGIESLGGMSMDHVKVHYNSDKPAQLNAHAYAQGSDIHIAPGQAQHLPHEAWHVVQQAQGRVKPTMQMKGKLQVNDDVGLEGEADLMGGRAAVMEAKKLTMPALNVHVAQNVVQRAVLLKKTVYGLPHWEVTASGDPSIDLDSSGHPSIDLEANGHSNIDLEANLIPKWQIGFSNPTGISATLGSVTSKSGSPSGFGGEGEVKWAKLKDGQSKKNGYTVLDESDNPKVDDQKLLRELPKTGTRLKYRLTSENCQHFIIDAWNAAGLNPSIAKHLNISKDHGKDLNNGLAGGLFGGALGLLGGVALGGLALMSLPAFGAAALGGATLGVAGIAVGRKWQSPIKEGKDTR